jgi:hypothetical protein
VWVGGWVGGGRTIPRHDARAVVHECVRATGAAKLQPEASPLGVP